MTHPPPAHAAFARRAPVIGLALGSGSARGWAHFGVLRALTDCGIRPGVVCGASIGALVGAPVAGLLSDRLKGQGGLVAPWPRDARVLSSAEKQELQQRLTSLGYDTQGTDGKIGQKTIDALTAWQRANGLAPDGYASAAVLERLRRS